MRLVIDLQGAQGGNAARGIGRYARELAAEMARRSGPHEVIVALNGGLPVEALRRAFAPVLPRDNIRVWHTQGGTAEATSRDPARRLAGEVLRAEFLASLAPDVIHVASVFEGWSDDAVTAWPAWRTRPPIVVTGYDLIPLIRREQYLDGAWKQGGLRPWYLRCLHEMRLADAILAISASSRQEMIGHLGADPDNVFKIRAGVGPEFTPPGLSETDRAALLQRLGLRADFVLYLGGGDLRKNEDALVAAYGLLPGRLRARHQLAIIGHAEPAALRARAEAAGIALSDLALIRFVDDADLPAVYASCALFVMPSLHEGFGLPAAEAMACGAPVIASNTTSLPEVIGREDALFDPSDPAAIAARMQTVLDDPVLRRELAAHGPRQASRFTWAESAARAWDALESTLAHIAPRRAAPACTYRPRLAYVSPVPPQQSGIAAYSAELIPELARHYDITIVADVAQTDSEHLAPNFPIISPSRFRREAAGFDRVLYQIGNSSFHETQIEDLLPRIPGTVTLHDAYLSAAHHAAAHRRGLGEDRFTELLYRSHGWPAVLSKQRTGAIAALHDFPCSLEVLQGALGVIQHSQHGRDILAAHFGPAAVQDVRIIPHLRRMTPGPDRQTARRQLGIPDDMFLICSFGYVAPSKLPERLLAAVSDPAFRQVDARLVFVGQTDESGALMLAAAASRLGWQLSELWTDHVDSLAYRTWLAAADVAVQLRTGSRGETSGAILDCMAAGLVAVISDYGSAAELPPDAAIRLPPDFTDAMLVETLLGLRDPAMRHAVAARARAHVETALSPRRIAAAYHAAIEAAYANGVQAARRRVVQGLAYALPSEDADATELAQCARAITRNFPALQPPRLLIDVGACAGLQPIDPPGALLAELLTEAAGPLRVDLVALRGGRWHYARTQAASLLGLPGPPAPDEPVDEAGQVALLCMVPPKGWYEAEPDQLRELRDVGVTLAALLAAVPGELAAGLRKCTERRKEGLLF